MRYSRLLTTTVLSGLGVFVASAALAQTPPAPVDTQDPGEAAQLDEVVVTGTRLRLPD